VAVAVAVAEIMVAAAAVLVATEQATGLLEETPLLKARSPQLQTTFTESLSAQVALALVAEEGQEAQNLYLVKSFVLVAAKAHKPSVAPLADSAEVAVGGRAAAELVARTMVAKQTLTE
jgi:hypothetical protein